MLLEHIPIIRIMMEDQSSKHEISYFCFNPTCFQPSNRAFSSTFQHPSQCSRWICTYPMLDPPSAYTTSTSATSATSATTTTTSTCPSPTSSLPISPQLFNSPIQTIIESPTTIAKIHNLLTCSLHQIREQVQLRLDAVQDQIWRQVHQYYEPMIEAANRIRKLMMDVRNGDFGRTKANAIVIDILHKGQFRELVKRETMVFVTVPEDIENSLYQQIQNLPEQVFRPIHTLLPDTSLPNPTKCSLREYLLHPVDDHTKKLSKISSILKINQSKLYEKGQQGQSSIFIVKCPICPANFVAEKRKDLMASWKSLCQHLMEFHVEEVGYGFRFGVENANLPVNVDEIVYKMTKYQYEALQLIFRSGRKIYNFHYTNRNRLTIDLIIKSQQSNLQFPTLSLNDSSQFHVAICSIAYHLQHHLSIQKPIYIYLCDNRQIFFLRRMIDVLNLSNVVFVGYRKFGEQQPMPIVEQEEGEDEGKDRDRDRDRGSDRDRDRGSEKDRERENLKEMQQMQY